MSDTAAILEQAIAWHRGGAGVAVATVIRTWGSSPRPVGSKLAVDDHGRMAGSVSGGCVEGAVIEAAGETIRDGQVRVLEFGVVDQTAWTVGLSCGGRIEVLVEPFRLEAAARVLAAIASDETSILVTRLDDGRQLHLRPSPQAGDLSLDQPDIDLLQPTITGERSAIIDLPSGRVFVEITGPPLRLIIIGAVHIAQPLVAIATLAGYRVSLIEPRGAFADAERFPGVAILPDWPDAALEKLGLTQRTALVALSHDPKIDDPALCAALASPAFYVGALGSRKTQAARRRRLAEMGLARSEIARIRGPVGLALGSITPAEIAISIMAEITAVRRGAVIGRRDAVDDF